GLAGLRGVTALVTFGLAAFVLAAIAVRIGQSVSAVRRCGGLGVAGAVLTGLARHRKLHGGLLAHAGVVMIAVAIAASQTYTTQERQRLEVGESITVSGYTARLDRLEEHRSARRTWVDAHLTLSRDGQPLGTYRPALSVYGSFNQTVGTPEVRSRLTNDVYLVLVESDVDHGTAVIDLSVRPLVVWLWIAAGTMAAGALVAGWPPRRTRPSPEPESSRPLQEAPT
ncbi:MAG: cytochrome c-type biogenesis CcmF C-terminal domain-containing protein, partial [Micromonosporaceae bacterium]